MWYNPVVPTELGGQTPTEVLWAIYQLLLATSTLLISLLIIWVVVKVLLWLLPNYWVKGTE